MRAGVLWLGTFALLPLGGAPLLAHSAFRRFSLPCRFVLSGGVGAVALSFVMTVFALAGVPWSVAPALVLAAALAASLRLLIGREEPGPATSIGEPGGAVATRIAHALSLLAVAAVGAAVATGAAGSNDLIFFWGPKAQQFAAARTLDAGFLLSPLHDYMHPSYPPLVTNLYALASMVAGRFAWGVVPLTLPLVLGATAAALPCILRTAVSRPTAAAASALVISALACIAMATEMAGNGDMPLLFFEALGMALLLSPLASLASGQLVAGILLAGAATAKVEGLPFALAAAALFFLARKDRGTPAGKTALLLLAPTALALGAWFAFGASRRLFYRYESYGSFLEIHPDHFGPILAALGRSLWSIGHALPFLVPLVALLVERRWSRRMVLPLGVGAALVGFALFAYLHFAGDPSEWIRWSAGRILSPVPVLLTLAATCDGTRGAGGERRREASPG